VIVILKEKNIACKQVFEVTLKALNKENMNKYNSCKYNHRQQEERGN